MLLHGDPLVAVPVGVNQAVVAHPDLAHLVEPRVAHRLRGRGEHPGGRHGLVQSVGLGGQVIHGVREHGSASGPFCSHAAQGVVGGESGAHASQTDFRQAVVGVVKEALLHVV